MAGCGNEGKGLVGAGKGNALIALIVKDEGRSLFLSLEDCSLSVGLSFSAFANCCIAAGADDGSFGDVLDSGVGDELLRDGFEVSVGGALWEPEAIACGAFAGGHLDKRHACLLEIRGGRGSGKSLRACFSGLGGLALGDSGFASCCLLVSSGLSDSVEGFFEPKDLSESFEVGSLTVGEVGVLPSSFPIEDTGLSDAGSPTEDC